MYPRNFCFGVCCLIALVAPIEARADLVTSFQGVTLDGNLHLDMPDSNVGSISLDTVNHNLLFTGSGADLWDGRNGLPYAWTAIPNVGVGGIWRAETEVHYNDFSTDSRIAGLTTYSGPDGSGGASQGQWFTFGLDHWDGPNGVWVQGLGNNHPGDSNNLVAGLDANTIDLKMDVTVGEGNSNTYDFYYKNPTDSDWASLGTIHGVDNNDRVALFFKGSDMNVSFDYFDVTTVFSAVPEPSTWVLVGCGFVALAAVRRFRQE